MKYSIEKRLGLPHSPMAEHMMQSCDKLRIELERLSKMPKGTHDALYEYRLWWDMQKIQSEGDDGWPMPFCFEYKNIHAFAKYWTSVPG